jgi:hypothetical protein
MWETVWDMTEPELPAMPEQGSGGANDPRMMADIRELPRPDAPLAKWVELVNPSGRPGRHTPPEDIWAAVEIHVKGRTMTEVYQEWLEQLQDRQLFDTWDSFKKAMRNLNKKLGRYREAKNNP